MYVLASMLQDLKAAQQQPRCHVDTSMITPRGGRHRRSLAENLGAGIAGAAASAAANCEFTVVQAMVNEVTAACCGPDQCAGGIPPTCSLECAEAYSGFYYAECMQGVDTGKAMNAFGELCLDLDISSVALALRAKHGDLADIGMHDMAAIEAAVPEPFTINFDANEQGQIQDGGHDMYDGGNRISTSLCPATPTSGWITPYTDDLQVVQSDCFGTGGSYRMDLGGAMMILLATNTGTVPLTVSISGNLGADNGGSTSHSDFTSGSLTGFMSTVCGTNDPSINHLFVIDGHLSPDAAHTGDERTDSDADEVAGIGIGSPIVYLLYSGLGNQCHNEDEHRAVFDALVAALQPCSSSGGGGDSATGGMCIEDTSFLADVEASIPNPHTIRWDASSSGQIQDGGGDMYDGGNQITTSLCTTRLQPYTDDFDEASSDCFGAGGSYHMDLRDSMMILLATNTQTASDLSITITGNLGSDGGGKYQHNDFEEGTLSGFSTSVKTPPANAFRYNSCRVIVLVWSRIIVLVSE